MTATLTQGSASEVRRNDQVVDLLRRMLVQLQSGTDAIEDDRPPLTMQQLRVMRILYNEGPTRVSVLARRLNVSTPTVTGILDRLVQRGMTAREDDPRDRRVVLNVLTEDGYRMIERLHPVRDEWVRQAVAGLSQEDLDSLARSLTSLLRSAPAEQRS